MASLSKDPSGFELEDFVAAHLASRRVYVETGITHRDPKDILELDVVWTDYRNKPNLRFPIEVKSGDWHLGDLFKFFGWTRYLHLPSGQFICKRLPNRMSHDSLMRLCKKLDINLIHIDNLNDIDTSLKDIGLEEPTFDWIPIIWRFSFWTERQYRKVINLSIENNICPKSSIMAKRYKLLVNDAIFFESDPRTRANALLSTHLQHRKLALTAANEIATGNADFESPESCNEFKSALYNGKYLPVQACLYLAHRGRIAMLKAAVDYYIAQKNNTLPKKIVKILDWECDVAELQINEKFTDAVNYLSKTESFVLFPIFWQVFIFSWGGFLLKDRIELEYQFLSDETGIPIKDIPKALSAFDILFESDGTWFVETENDSRIILKLTPPATRGIGSYARLKRYEIENYKELGYNDQTTKRMIIDHNTTVRLLSNDNKKLLK